MALRTIKTDKQNNLAQAFFEIADNYPNLIAMKAKGGEGESYTYSKLKELIQSVASYLSHPEFDSCKEIGLLSENRPEWGIAYLILTKL